MRLNTRCCTLCGELRGGNLRVAGQEICAVCEGALVRGSLPPETALLRLRGLSRRVRWTAG